MFDNSGCTEICDHQHESYGLIQDAGNNAKFVMEMISIVKSMVQEMVPKDDYHLCIQIMATNALDISIETLKNDCIDFIDEAVQFFDDKE
jgi:hypothetical protein